MFFITNNENNIIAADADFIQKMGMANLYELMVVNTNGMIDESSKTFSNNKLNANFNKTEIISPFGKVNLFQLNEIQKQIETVEENHIATPKEPIVPEVPLVEEPIIVETPAMEEPLVPEVHIVEKPIIVETPTIEEPLVPEVPLVEEPLMVETPAMKEELVIETTTMEEPLMVETSITKEPALQTNEADILTIETPPTQEPSAPSLVIEEPEIDMENINQSSESQLLEDLEKELLASIQTEEPILDFSDSTPSQVEASPMVETPKEEPETEEDNEDILDLFAIEEPVSVEPDISIEESNEDELFGFLDTDNDDLVKKEEPKPTKPISMDEPLLDLGLGGTNEATKPTINKTVEPIIETTIAPESTIKQEPITMQEPTPVAEPVVPEPVVEQKPKTVQKPLIDIKASAEAIGVDEEQYLMFLNDFITEAKSSENDLRNDNKSSRDEASSAIEEASMLLGIPIISEELDKLKVSTPDNRNSIVDRLMSLLDQINNPDTSTQVENSTNAELSLDDDLLSLGDDEFFKEAEKPKENVTRDVSPEDALATFLNQTTPTPAKKENTNKPIQETIDVLDLGLDDDSTSSISEAPVETPTPVQPQSMPQSNQNKPMPEITLENTTAIPFDFSINQASEELTLPSDLVKEFINDFIVQAKENLPVLQDQYNNRDMDSLEKTAHLLKGASSNLRVVHMAETLEKLQLNKEFALVPDLIKTFAGQLKALIAHMNP